MVLLLYSLTATAGFAADTLPAPSDAHSWGLRVRMNPAGPYLVGECPNYPAIEVLLINKSSAVRSYPDLRLARRAGELSIRIVRTDGRGVSARFEPIPRRVGDTLPELQPRGRDSAKFGYGLNEFGYDLINKPGVYIVQASFRALEGEVKSPPWKIEVLGIPPEDVLASHRVPLVGFLAKQNPAVQDRVMVQQVRVRGKVFLIHTVHAGPKYGGGVEFTTRLAELPGKCEMTVEGTYGELGPLTIIYKTSPTAEPTKLVVNSVGGRPWTAEDERSHQERLRAKGEVPPPAPPPRPIKP
jgi:hypothetical protein